MTIEQYTQIAYPHLAAVSWQPINVSFSHAICNVDGSVILLADEASQAAIGQQVVQFEAVLIAAGLPIVPRSSMEAFHVTIGTTNASFPMQTALAEINTIITSWTDAPIALRNFVFFFPPFEVKAH